MSEKSEKMIYGGAILSGVSIIISGILIVLIIMAINAGEEPRNLIYILPFMAVLLIAGVATIIYATRE